MIGVVLWCDAADRKAVIWCEDQGDLAFLDCGSAQFDKEEDLKLGDVLRFEVCLKDNLRLAKNASRLLDNWGDRLNRVLDQLPKEPGAETMSEDAEVVPFNLRKASPWEDRKTVRQRRLG